MNSRGRIFPLGPTMGLLLFACLVLFFIGIVPVPARACWTGMLYECFDGLPTDWPWSKPVGTGRGWHFYPGDPGPHWDIQAFYFSTAMCLDHQSCWCIGHPHGNDPQFDQYNANMDTYLTYGPLNLTNAMDARCVFQLLNRSEYGHDSVYWGAATAPSLTPANMKVGGSFSGNSPSNLFQFKTLNLKDLHNYSAPYDSASVLGLNGIYVFWRFKADANSVRDFGTFIDDVVIAIDDGGVDISAGTITFCHPDNTEMSRPPMLNDTVKVKFRYYCCSGGTGDYGPFRIIGRLDTTLLFDTLIVGAGSDSSGIFYTNTFVTSDSGNHVIRFKCDSLSQITETNENNNASTASFYITPPNIPPTFVWITPSTDTLWANENAIIRYECYDSDDESIINFYYDADQNGCVGPAITGGANILEHDGPDSLTWNVINVPNGRVSYPFVKIQDYDIDTCIYAPYPIVVRHTAAEDPVVSGIPSEYYLDQNYPNPFNPVTDLRYGVSKGGQVTLKVYDVLGREVVTLVNEVLTPGRYITSFDGSHLSSGIYLYTLATPEGTLSRKMMLLK
jgi:hypothetical protein